MISATKAMICNNISTVHWPNTGTTTVSTTKATPYYSSHSQQDPIVTPSSQMCHQNISSAYSYKCKPTPMQLDSRKTNSATNEPQRTKITNKTSTEFCS